VIRQGRICDGFWEELALLNHNETPVDVTIRIDANSDFAHLFGIKNAHPRRRFSTASIPDPGESGLRRGR
jgi:N-terminal domain of (some) glycogen debranching enzymes